MTRGPIATWRIQGYIHKLSLYITLSMFLYLLAIFFACVCCIVVHLVVQQERVHHNLLKGVEGYDKDSMKHTETQEKVCLPDPEG
jgi:Thymosin beta-4 family